MAADVFDGVLWTLALTVSPAFTPLDDVERKKFIPAATRALKSQKFRKFTSSLEKTAPLVTLFVALVAILGPRLLLALEARKHNVANATRRGQNDSNGPGPSGNVHANTDPRTPGPTGGNTGSPSNGRAPSIRDVIGYTDQPPIR